MKHIEFSSIKSIEYWITQRNSNTLNKTHFDGNKNGVDGIEMMRDYNNLWTIAYYFTTAAALRPLTFSKMKLA